MKNNNWIFNQYICLCNWLFFVGYFVKKKKINSWWWGFLVFYFYGDKEETLVEFLSDIIVVGRKLWITQIQRGKYKIKLCVSSLHTNCKLLKNIKKYIFNSSTFFFYVYDLLFINSGVNWRNIFKWLDDKLLAFLCNNNIQIIK